MSWNPFLQSSVVRKNAPIKLTGINIAFHSFAKLGSSDFLWLFCNNFKIFIMVNLISRTMLENQNVLWMFLVNVLTILQQPEFKIVLYWWNENIFWPFSWKKLTCHRPEPDGSLQSDWKASLFSFLFSLYSLIFIWKYLTALSFIKMTKNVKKQFKCGVVVIMGPDGGGGV